MKRCICLILVLCFLISLFTACDNEETISNDTIVVDGLTIDTKNPDRTGLYDLYWVPLPTGQKFLNHDEIAYDSDVTSDKYKTAYDAYISYNNELVIPIYHRAEEAEPIGINPRTGKETYSGVPLSLMKISLEDFAYDIFELEWFDGELWSSYGDDKTYSNLIKILPTYNGGYFGVLNGRKKNSFESTFYFLRWDRDGKRVYTIDAVAAVKNAVGKEILPSLTSLADAADINTNIRQYYSYFVDKDDYLYVMDKSEVSVWSPEGEFVRCFGVTGQDLTFRKVDQHLIVTEDGESAFVHMNRTKHPPYIYTLFGPEGLGDNIDLPETTMGLAQLASGFDAYQVTSVGVQAHRYKGDPVMLLNWVDYDIRYTDILMTKVISADKIFIKLQDSETGEIRFGVFSATNIEGQIAQQMNTNKTELTLAYIAGSNSRSAKTIESYVTEFNLKNSDYRIKMLAYTAVGNQSAEDMLTSDIISGKIPDMILFDSDMNYRKFDNQKLFYNIYEFMDKDDTYNRDAFFNCVMKPFENGSGELPYLTLLFGISTLTTSKETAGKLDGWNISEMVSFAKSLDRDQYFIDIQGMGSIEAPMALLRVLLPNTICHYVDYENAKTTFGGDLAKLLEFCKTTNVSLSPNGVTPPMYRDGTVAVRVMGSIQTMQDFLGNRYCHFSGDELTYLGFPTEGNCGSVIVPITSLAITKKGTDPDGAWGFIKFCLDMQLDEWKYTVDPQEIADGSQPMFKPESGFSGVKDTVELMCETLSHYFFYMKIAQSVDNPDRLAVSRSAGGMHLAADGGYGESDYIKNLRKDVSTAFYTVTDEDTVDLTQLFENITMARSYDKDLLDIIYEDAQYYFNGTKSLEETVRIIENRVGIKLAE